VKEEKLLMTISNAVFGLGGYQWCELGLFLTFSNGSFGQKADHSFWDYTSIQKKEGRRWSEADRDLAMAKIMQELSTYLYAAKVQFVHELVGVPVEVTLIDDRMSSFRIVESEVIL